jgi:hypothetical protein
VALLGDLVIVFGAFLVTVLAASVAGAANLGVALGVGQVGFVAAVTFVLLRR